MVGCLLRLALLPMTIAILYFSLIFHGSWPNLADLAKSDSAAITAIIAGILFWFVIVSWLDLRFLKTDRSLINRSFVYDGERIVASGQLKAKAPLITSPFSGQECIGYYYKVTHTSLTGRSHTKWTDYEGYALIPTVITSKKGDLKILGHCNSELFHDVSAVTSDNMMNNAMNYLKTIECNEVINGPGDFHVDKKIGKDPDFERCKFEEKVILEKEPVLVAGVYSQEDGSIVPDPDEIMKPFHIVPAGEAVLNRKIRNRFVGIAICTVFGVTAIVFHLFVFFAG